MVMADGQWLILAALAAVPAAALGGFLGMGGSAMMAPALAVILMAAFPLNLGEAFIYGLFAAHACALAAAIGGIIAHGPTGRGGARASYPFWPSLFAGSAWGFYVLIKAQDVLHSWLVAAYFIAGGVIVLARGVGSKALPEAPLNRGRGAWAMRGALGFCAGVFCGMIGSSCSALGLPWVIAAEKDCQKCASKTMAMGMPVAIAGILIGLAAPFFGLGPSVGIQSSAGWVNGPLLAVVVPIGFFMGFLGAKTSRFLPQRALRPLVAVFMVMVGLDLANSKWLDGMGYLGPGELISAAVAPSGPGLLAQERTKQIQLAQNREREERQSKLKADYGRDSVRQVSAELKDPLKAGSKPSVKPTLNSTSVADFNKKQSSAMIRIEPESKRNDPAQPR